MLGHHQHLPPTVLARLMYKPANSTLLSIIYQSILAGYLSVMLRIQQQRESQPPRNQGDSPNSRSSTGRPTSEAERIWFCTESEYFIRQILISYDSEN